MKYYIPLNKIDQLEKMLNRAIKKGGAISFSKGEEITLPGTLWIHDPKTSVVHSETIMVRCVEVDVTGAYKLNGWEFVGTVEFTPNGNIIRLADSKFEGKVPERYNHTEPVCEHCHTHRVRKDTFLIYNSETQEFKQVGRNCLLEYTQGLDAEICAGIMSSLDKTAVLQNYDYSWDDFVGNKFDSTYASVESSLIKAYAYSVIKKFGYQKSGSENSTIEDVLELAFSFTRKARLKGIEPDDSILPEIDEFAKSIQDTYGYMYNAKIAWLNEYAEARDVGLLASFIAVYLREKEKKENFEKEKKASQHIGKVGDRIEIEVSEARVLWYNDMWGTSLYSIKDKDGNVYLWSTGCQLVGGEKIKATVKAHEEYKGLLQTVITRGKVQ